MKDDQERGFVHLLLFVGLITIIGIGVVVFYSLKNTPSGQSSISKLVTANTPTPTAYQFPYTDPVIPKTRSYRTIIVGDSIIRTLGPNANQLRDNLIEYYPDSEFVNYNYGYGSTNVLSLPERLHEDTTYIGETKTAILKQGFELIIIESFAFNPLSEFPLEEGLAKQTEVLEESVMEILREKPSSAIAFMTPIAPSVGDFGRGVVDLSDEQRGYWANERIAYIENHRKFAEAKGIPVIDVYKSSLMEDGLVDKKYVSNDFIHPSDEGIKLMSREIADYIFENKIFPE